MSYRTVLVTSDAIRSRSRQVHVSVARDADLEAIAALVNSGYRGDRSRASRQPVQFLH